MAPAVHALSPMTLPPATTTLLDNGIKLHTLSGGKSAVSRIKIILPGGLVESDRPGLMRMAGNLMLEGSKSYPGNTLSETLEYNGAWTGIDMATHHSMLNLYCINRSYESLLPISAEMVTHPLYEPEAVSQALQAEAARLEVERHKVAYKASVAMNAMIYGKDHPLAADPEPDELLSITPEMLRHSHSRRLDPEGMHVYLSGLLTDDMIEQAVRVFSSIPPSEPYPLRDMQFAHHLVGERRHISMPESKQSAVRMVIPVIGREHPDYVPLRMAVIALGGYFGSRLMLNIREDKGLTYGISSALIGYRNSGFLSISSQTDHTTVEELIDETISEIERMKNPSSYTADEIDRLSRYVLSELAGVLDTPFTRTDFLSTEITASTPPGYFEMQQEAARAASAGTLAEMARRYFDTGRLFIATAGR